MHAGVDLRVMLRRLGYAEQPVDLRHQHRERATLTQHFDEARGMGLDERTPKFLADPLGRQGF